LAGLLHYLSMFGASHTRTGGRKRAHLTISPVMPDDPTPPNPLPSPAPGMPPNEPADQSALDALAAVQAAIEAANLGDNSGEAVGVDTQNIAEQLDEMRNAVGASASVSVAAAGVAPSAFTMPAFEVRSGAQRTPAGPAELVLLNDVNLNVKIELGRTRMLIEDVLKLSEGAVVELDKLAGDPVDVYVNDRPVARGEVLVLNDNFCVRINEILDSTAFDRSTAS